MILILSKEDFELTTEDVIDWLDYHKASWIRLNGEDLEREEEYCFFMPESDELHIGGIEYSGINSIWFRRGGKYQNFEELNDLNYELRLKVKKYLVSEVKTLRNGLASFFESCNSENNPKNFLVNKLDCLKVAHKCGFTIPETIVTNNLKSLRKFAQRFPRIITKSLSESATFQIKTEFFILHTQEINLQKSLPDFFSPSLIQQYIDKAYEIRTFYLNGSCYSMAIFSQNDTKTSIDFRKYNLNKPNRTVPFKLPDEMEKKIRTFMTLMNLTSGSIDMVRTPDGGYVFLEVNPSGQFNMVSIPCNYNLEKKMAKFLILNQEESE